ncbi:MAG: hypothetical protein GF411_06870 [Candidatus Lokiarchaeota archaeon]|nr:hypothetical protein [Candidatus Lokiarchaeota archaeon]
MSKRIKRLRLMAEYKSTGIFVESPRPLIGEISHDHLNISPELSEAIFRWIDEFDSWLNWDDPMNSPSVPEKEINRFNKQGEELMKQLQKELGPSIKVRYVPTK